MMSKTARMLHCSGRTQKGHTPLTSATFSLYHSAYPQDFSTALAVEIDFDFFAERTAAVGMEINAYLAALPWGNGLFRPICDRAAAFGANGLQSNGFGSNVLKNKAMLDGTALTQLAKIVLGAIRPAHNRVTSSAKQQQNEYTGEGFQQDVFHDIKRSLIEMAARYGYPRRFCGQIWADLIVPERKTGRNSPGNRLSVLATFFLRLLSSDGDFHTFAAYPTGRRYRHISFPQIRPMFFERRLIFFSAS